MDEIGVHSLLNANRSIVPDRDTTSPVQMVAGKDSSNPLMAVTLPKSEKEEEISSTIRRKLPQTCTTGSSSRDEDSVDHVSDSKFLESNYAQDPNDNYDSGMSFDSVARHNQDT
ncbi:hypothetical protein RND71_030887 [Anisodus tanguticus]|uniref:Uncharacterized protein n=1 Tax=Anisodus tanguticus TaxID=243964 RepID=A0AAE1RI33_9SOLA|nr:hypothetical protein RND71_030887 [Anisodus tanguticus]